jgi:hypothetical protein
MSDTATTPEIRPATARAVVYPSRTVRSVPSFVFLGPEGWIVDEAPDALIVVRAPQPVDGFWLNAILSHDRVAASVDLEAAAKATWARVLRDSPNAKAEFERVARFGDNIVYLRGVELDAPQSGRKLGQIHALFMAPKEQGRKTADLFQFVITSPAELMPQLGPGFVEMIASFRFV